MSTSDPRSAPRWYGYFQVTTSTYGAGSPGGAVVQQADLTWFGVPNSRVLVLTHRQTPLPDLGDERSRVMHEWVVVVDDETTLPLYATSTGDRDELGHPQPAFGVFVRLTSTFRLNSTQIRDYLPRQATYAVTDLLRQSDPHNAPLGLMISGVREVISHLDNASWEGPGSLIVYDRESSFGWISRSEAEDFDPPQHARWVPGSAGVYERFLIGTGTLDGWALYAIQNLLVLEFWAAGVQLTSRVLRCDDLAHLMADPDARFVIGFGYDLPAGKISIGAAGRGEDSSALAFREFIVPELRDAAHTQRRVYIGGAPVLYSDGSEASRTAWAHVQPVSGQFTSDAYLTRGGLTQLMQETP